MKKQQKSIDGFTLRRSGSQLGGLHTADPKRPTPEPIENREINITGTDESQILGVEQEDNYLGRLEINESLRGIENAEDQPKKLSRRERRQRRKMEKGLKKPKSKFRRYSKRIFIVLLLIALGFGGYTGYKLLNASNSVFSGGIFNAFQSVPLKQDANGRSNFLILGTSEDDPGHEGANLTDSIMVVSISQTDNNAYMFSVPRDLYVEYGMPCNSGYRGKVNEYFYCVNEGETTADEQERLEKSQAFIGDIFGIDIQYGVHVNYTVLKQAVDAVGGIDVDIQGSNGDDGILDRNFDDRCNYTCYNVKYTNGIHHLNGQQALDLARVRGHSAPTYGLGNSNFDREKNQQKIVIALRDKAVSTGSVTNISAVTKLIDALGSNLRTNIATKEIRTLLTAASKTKQSNIHSLSFIGDGTGYMSTGSYDAYSGSTVMPAAGFFVYDDIRAYIAQNLSSNPLIRESAPIVVLNGSGTEGFGQTNADQLEVLGYNISIVDNAPDGTYAPVEIYQIGEDSAGTAAALAKKYDVTIKTTTPPVAVNDDIRFVIVFGPVVITTAEQS